MSNPLGTISRDAIDAAADRKEAIFDLVANLIWDRDEAELTPPQRTVGTLLLYDNEVNNGGHLQYFHNQGIGSNDELLRALAELGADCQRAIFAEAARQAAEHPVEPVDSLEDYHERALEQEYRKLDSAYYECRPELGRDLLPAYVEAHLDEFLEIE